MYNLRYHIASLVAVFLALTVGLVLGTIVAQSGLQQKLVTQLTNQFETLNTLNKSLGNENAALTSFAAEASPRVADNVLLGRTIVVIADPDSVEAVAQASEAISMAGGFPAVATFNASGLSLSQPDAQSEVVKLLGLTDASEITTRVVSALAREWTTPGDARKLTDALVSAGALRLQDLPATATVTGCVVSAVYAEVPDPAAITLAKALGGPGRVSAGVETVKRPTGFAKAAVDAGLSAVDDVDSPLGKISLVWVLSGRATGWFGVLGGADAPYPKPLFPAQ